MMLSLSKHNQFFYKKKISENPNSTTLEATAFIEMLKVNVMQTNNAKGLLGVSEGSTVMLHL